MGLLEIMKGSVQPFIADGVVARNLAREAAIDFKVKAKRKLSPKIAKTLNTLQIVARIAREKGVREKLASSAPILGEAIHLVGSNYAELIIIGGPALAIFVYDRLKTRQVPTIEQPKPIKSVSGRYYQWIGEIARENGRLMRNRNKTHIDLDEEPTLQDIPEQIRPLRFRTQRPSLFMENSGVGVLDLVQIRTSA